HPAHRRSRCPPGHSADHPRGHGDYRLTASRKDPVMTDSPQPRTFRATREAVIVDAVRTPVGKRGGALAAWHPADLLGATLSDLVRRSDVAPDKIDDVIAGCVMTHDQQSSNIARHAVLSSGLPDSVPAVTVDRQCGSGQQAVAFAAHGVEAGSYDLAIACGV